MPLSDGWVTTYLQVRSLLLAEFALKFIVAPNLNLRKKYAPAVMLTT